MAVGTDIEDKTSRETVLEVSLFHVAAEQGGEEHLMAVKFSDNNEIRLQLTPGNTALLYAGILKVLIRYHLEAIPTQTKAIN